MPREDKENIGSSVENHRNQNATFDSCLRQKKKKMVAVRFFSIPLFSHTFLAVRGEQADFCPFTKKSTVSWMAGKKEGVGCELRKGREMVRIDYCTTQ